MPFISYKLVREVLQELKYFPYHAYKVSTSRAKNGVCPHEKYYFGTKKNQYLCWFEPREVLHEQLIVFYHGGGWTFGTPELFSDRAKIFTDLGYRVVMPAHRKLPLHNYSQIREDLILTLQQIASIFDQKNINKRKIVVGGMSSGGNLAGLLLFDRTLWQNTNLRATNFAGGFFCGAPLNLEGMTDSFLLEGYAGKRKSPTFQRASPMYHLSKKINYPILVVHGTKDGLVNYSGTERFVQELQRVNKKTTDFYTIKRGSHLKSVSWAYENNEVRAKILSWLTTL
ncbi:MAG: alpha/beta hydrolase [Bacteroidota bacterium]